MSVEEKDYKQERRFTRVGLSRTVSLFLGEDFYEQIQIRNLSVGGLFVEGDYSCKSGDLCEVELQETGSSCSLFLKLGAVVRRVEKDGLALQFNDMSNDSFMFLQTVVLYSAEDPRSAAKEFLDDFFRSSGIESDSV